MKQITETVRTFDLDGDQLLVLDGGRDGRVRVLHGATWLTHEGEPGDTFLGAGAERSLPSGRTLIGGLGPARLQWIEAVPDLGGQVLAWLRQAWRRVGRQLARLQLGPAADAKGC